MFAVFLKGVFIDWWLNQNSDMSWDWVGKTAQARGWNLGDVKVVEFTNRPPVDKKFSFTSDQKLVTYRETSLPDPDNAGSFILGYETEDTALGKLYYDGGRYL